MIFVIESMKKGNLYWHFALQKKNVLKTCCGMQFRCDFFLFCYLMRTTQITLYGFGCTLLHDIFMSIATAEIVYKYKAFELH